MSNIKLDLFNLNHVTRIIVVGEQKCKDYGDYKVYKERNFWGCVVKFHRVYEGWWTDTISFQDALKKFNIKKGVLFYRPYTQLFLSSGEKLSKQFKTVAEAIDYARVIEAKTGIKFEERRHE